MNPKLLILDKLEEYFNEIPDYTMGDILYSAITEVSKGRTHIKKSDIRKIDNNMFYRILSKSLTKEKS